MPLLRGGSGVRGRSRDIVSQVEDKLKLNTGLPREILEATRSSLRVLKIRNPIGCFGKYDNETKRACALIEYDVREYTVKNNNNDIEVAMEQLAKAAFMKLKDFRDFHEKIGNFRDNLRINATTTSKSKGKIPNDTSKSRRAAVTTNKSGIVFGKSSISSLAIQLGAFVPNSSDVALRAHRLFQEVVNLLKKSSNKGDVYGLRDVKKNQNSYEAACFYRIATSGRDQQDNSSSTRSFTRHRRRSSKEYDDEDDNHQLDLNTFMDVTKVSPKFQMILGYVNELQNEIESTRTNNPNPSLESSRSQPPFPSSNYSQTTKSTASRKRSKEDAFGSERNISESPADRKPEHAADIDINDFFHDHKDKKETKDYQMSRKQISHSNTTFEEWKSKVLRDTCENARQKINESKERNYENREKKQISFQPEGILDFVTRRILARNGLLLK